MSGASWVMTRRKRLAWVVAAVAMSLAVAGGVLWHQRSVPVPDADTDRMDADQQHQLLQEIGYIK